MDKPRSKETLLAEVDRLRGQARRARRLATALDDGQDRTALLTAATDFDGQADKIEKAAADAGPGGSKR
ncbi:MAG: hypothetical protein ACHQPH_17210 [Reyranellales bacterium]|jgi:hypothetical protein